VAHGAFSQSGPWRPAVVARLARTLGVANIMVTTRTLRMPSRSTKNLGIRTSTASACFAIAVSIPASAQQTIPAYIGHAKDPVQIYISQALVGFAFQKKCFVVAPAEEAAYERALNRANLTFHGYVLAKGFVTQPSEAVNYSREIAMGAIRYAATIACDVQAKDRVVTGHRVATDFQALIEPYLNQPQAK
jgi:hypothetical protein